MVVKVLIERTGVDANAIDEVIPHQGADGWRRQNPARQSAIKEGCRLPRFRHYHYLTLQVPVCCCTRRRRPVSSARRSALLLLRAAGEYEPCAACPQ